MVVFLRQWTITIVTIVVLITFIEIILPKSDFKKYINLASGFLLIIVILNPFIKLLDKDINIEKEVFKNIMLNSKNEFYISQTYKDFQQKQTLELFKNKISKHIKKTIEDNFEYKVIEIDIDVEWEDKRNIGNIKRLYITLARNGFVDNKKNNEAHIKIEPIEKIKVGKNEKLKDEIIVDNRVDEIKTLISNIYKIQNEIITIIYR